jgi:hypothetical protein
MDEQHSFTYKVPVWDRCAVCGERRMPTSTWLSWWWHSACRKNADPNGWQEYVSTMLNQR